MNRGFFLKVLRLVFVIFSLSLMGDVLYRWDGVRYYASFSEFLPSIALISILWCIVSITTGIIVWLISRIVLFMSRGLRANIEDVHLLLYILVCSIMTAGLWIVLDDNSVLLSNKFALVVLVSTTAGLVVWCLRKKAEHFMNIIHERITPLVWMFCMIVVLSIPLVAYHGRWKPDDKDLISRFDRTVITDINRPNILLVTFDALAAESMTAYRYERQTTPFISLWAESGTLFTKAEAEGNYTAPTIASLMTGKRVWTHRRYHAEGLQAVRIDNENLPLLLKDAGYYNMAFIQNHLASVQRLGISGNFNFAPLYTEFQSSDSIYSFFRKYLYNLFDDSIIMYDWFVRGDFILHKITPSKYVKYPDTSEYPVENVFNMFFREIDKGTPWPFFAWLHLYPPHAPYLAPEQYHNLFDSSNKFRGWKEQQQTLRPRFFSKEQQNEADIIRARYDEYIAYCDREYEKFIENLEKRGLLKNTIIILSSDHGESFEHGYYTHGGPFLFEEMTRIPLIIKEPGQINGKVIDVPVGQIDIAASILDYADIKAPSWVEGRSLRPLLRGNKPKSRPIFSMYLDRNPVHEKITKGTIAVWENDYKLIHYLENDESQLFNLKKDPDEMHDIMNDEKEVGQYLLDLILNNLEKVNKETIDENRYDSGDIRQ